MGYFEPVQCRTFHSVNSTQGEHCDYDSRKIASKNRWQDIEILYKKLAIDSLDIADNDKNVLKSIIKKYTDRFSVDEFDLGECFIYTANITQKLNHDPVWVPTRSVPYKLQGVMDQKIAENY